MNSTRLNHFMARRGLMSHRVICARGIGGIFAMSLPRGTVGFGGMASQWRVSKASCKITVVILIAG